METLPDKLHHERPSPPDGLPPHHRRATKRVLTQQLNELESMGIVRKVVYDVVPMKVEYFLTEPGESLVPIIRAMDEWGERHKALFDENGNINQVPTPCNPTASRQGSAAHNG